MRAILMASTALCLMASAAVAQNVGNVAGTARSAGSVVKAVERGNDKAALQQAGSVIRSTTGVRVPTNERQAVRTVQGLTSTPRASAIAGGGGYGKAARQAARSQAWSSAAAARSQRLDGYAAKNYTSTSSSTATGTGVKTGTATAGGTATTASGGGTKSVTPPTPAATPRVANASGTQPGTAASVSKPTPTTAVPGTQPGTLASVGGTPTTSNNSRAQQTNAQREKLFSREMNDYY